MYDSLHRPARRERQRFRQALRKFGRVLLGNDPLTPYLGVSTGRPTMFRQGKKRGHSTFSESLWSIPIYACLTRAFIGRVLREHRESVGLPSFLFPLPLPMVLKGAAKGYPRLRVRSCRLHVLEAGHPCCSNCGRRTRPFGGRAFREHGSNVGVLPLHSLISLPTSR